MDFNIGKLMMYVYETTIPFEKLGLKIQNVHGHKGECIFGNSMT